MSSEPARQLVLVTGASRGIGAAVALLPLMPAGGRIIYVTSHWAHFYGQKPVIAPYTTIAASKRWRGRAARPHPRAGRGRRRSNGHTIFIGSTD